MTLSPSPCANTYKFHKQLVAAFQTLGISTDQALRMGTSELTVWPVIGYDDLNATWMCGHRVSDHDDVNAPRGPCDGIDLVIIGPYPEPEDVSFTRHFVGKISGVVLEALEAYKVDLSRVYYTTVGRHALPAVDKKYKANWAEAGEPFCLAEISAMRPKAIFAMGSQAVKMLFGKQTSVEAIRGNHKIWNGIAVVPTTNPAQFLSGYAGIDEWEHDLREVLVRSGLSDGIKIVRDDIATRDYRLAVSPDEWEQTVDYILAQNPTRLAFDCEWGNDVGREEFTYNLSVQVSWGPRTAAFFALRAPGVAPEFLIKEKDDLGKPEKYPKPGHNVIHDAAALARCRAALTRLLKDSPAQLGGHSVRADVRTLLLHEGIDLTEKLTKAFDTMLVHHLLHQDDDQGLEVLVRKYAPEMGSYWEELQVWLKENNNALRTRFGYRDIPAHILIPYALCDADGTMRSWLRLEEEWKGPEFDKIRALYYNSVIKSNEAILEMETGGLLLDIDRMRKLNAVFKERFTALENEVCEKANWPTFNIRSAVHVQELLFSSTMYKNKAKIVEKNKVGLEKLAVKQAKRLKKWEQENPEKTIDEYDEYEDDAKGGPIPPTARLLRLDPVANTDKYPIAWADIVAEKRERYHSPSTKAESLKIILKSGVIDPKKAVDEQDREYRAYATFIVQAVHDLKILDQYLKNFLKLPTPNEFILNVKTMAYRVAPPEEQPGPDEIRVNEDGASFLDRMSQITGRVTGTILQTTDTGRCRMSKANLQVFPKKQESEIKRIMGERKVPKVKSCVVPENYGMKVEVKTDDDDWVITEADFKQAENWIMAIVGHDENMLRILKGGRDIHSENCVNSFKPAMPPWWAWSGDDPEKGAKFSDEAEARTAVNAKTGKPYEHVRIVKALSECLDDAGKVIKTPNERYSDYDVWNNVVKALFPGQRTAAKSVSFGIPYGRGARALTREIGKAGVQVTVDDTQNVVDVFNTTFSGVRKMLDDARESAISKEYVESVFGRRRYFTGVSRLGKARQAAAQREAGNFPIQGAVGDLLFVALVNLVTLRRTLPGCPPFKIRLVIHDAIVLEHRRRDTKFIHDLVRFCMGEANPIPGTDNEHLDADIETFERWSENTIMKS